MRRGPGTRYGLPVGAKECSPFIEVPHLAFLGKHWSARNFAAFYWCTGGISCVRYSCPRSLRGQQRDQVTAKGAGRCCSAGGTHEVRPRSWAEGDDPCVVGGAGIGDRAGNPHRRYVLADLRRRCGGAAADGPGTGHALGLPRGHGSSRSTWSEPNRTSTSTARCRPRPRCSNAAA